MVAAGGIAHIGAFYEVPHIRLGVRTTAPSAADNRTALGEPVTSGPRTAGEYGFEMFPRDHGMGDSRLMGPVSGLLWLTAGIAAAICQLLPGMPARFPEVAWALIGIVVVYGMACVCGWIAWEKASIRHHAAAVAAFQPLIAVGLWVSGGVDSCLGPILVLPTLYIAYFFPLRLACPLAILEIATYFTPVLYSNAADTHLLVGRTVMYAAA